MATETKTDTEAASEADVAVTEMAAEVSKLRSELAGAIENIARLGREKVEAITGSDPVTHGIAAGEAAIDGATRELRALEHDIAEATRANPWRALGVAALLGFVVGLLVRR